MNGLAQLAQPSVQGSFVAPQIEQNALLALLAMRGQQPAPAWQTGPVAAPAASQGQWDMGEPVDPVINALFAVESSSSLDNPNWAIRGPVVPRGRYAGERAIGPAQIMPGNVAEWSVRHVGQRLDPDALAAGLASGDPRAQDAYLRMVRGQVADYQARGYSPEEIAIAWHSGPGGVARYRAGRNSPRDGANGLPTYGRADSYTRRFLTAL